MSTVREFFVRLAVTPPSLAERRFAETVLFVTAILTILMADEILAWALGYDQ